jgi:hypothetical protein
MKTTCPIANVSPSKYTNPAVFNRMAEEMLFLANIGVKRVTILMNSRPPLTNRQIRGIIIAT